MLQFIKNHRITLNYYISLFIVLLVSIILTFLVFNIQPNTMSEVMVCIEKNPVIIWLNFIPIFLICLFIFFISNNISIAIVLTTWITIIFSLINRYKILIRMEPFLPADLSLGAEAFTIMKDFKFNISHFQIFIILLAIIASILLIIFIKTKKINIYIRVISVALSIIIIILLNSSVYSNKELYSSLYTKGSNCFQVNYFNSRGFAYCFWYFRNSNKVEIPENYNSKDVEILLKEYGKNGDNKNSEVNVIIIMGEAFSDISNNQNINFEGYINPLENFEHLKKEGVSGYIITPNFGGGTANTEFDVLTGLSTKFINEAPSSFWYIRKPFESIVSAFKDNGYDAKAIHPGHAWFYNRQNVYEHLGFNESIFKDSFLGADEIMKGGYVSEKATIDKIINTFENSIDKSNNPLFLFCVTIQNHLSYVNKYKGISKNFNTNIPISEGETNWLSNYFEGLKDADIELKRLTDYLNKSNEPVIIMYFGDHLPSFNGGLELYKKLEYPMNPDTTIEERLNMYKVPYLIWQNEESKKIINIKERTEELELNKEKVINANYLGGMFLEIINLNNIPAFFRFSNELLKELPVMTRNGDYKIKSGYTNELPDELKDKSLEYRKLQYYRLTN